jgi:signal transduction histidine kinase
MKSMPKSTKSNKSFKVFERSLLMRIAVGQIVSIFLFCLLVSINLLWQFQKDGDGENDRAMYLEAKAIARSIENEKAIINLETNVNLLSGFLTAIYHNERTPKTDPPLIALRIFDQFNRQIYRSDFFPEAASDYALGSTKTLTVDNREWRLISYTSPSKKTTIHLAKTTYAFNDELWPIIQRYILQPMLWFLPLSALATYLAALKGLQPLRLLARLISKRTAHDLSPIEQRSPYSETRPIIEEINSLLDRLKATLQRERSFLADAAHELRTPLAVIQVQADVLTNTEKPSEKLEASNELRQGIERTAALLRRLLMIARVDPDSFTPRYQEVELSSFVQERVASLAPLAVQKLLDISMSTTGQHTVEIDSESLVSAVDNVLDNAIRYTPNGEKINITIHGNETHAVLKIADSGIGIPNEHQKSVFERFFRVPGTEQHGSGLGLAIVKQVMALHKGEVTLTDGLDGRGLTVCLKLPYKQIHSGSMI